MRYRLLASASLAAIAIAVAGPALAKTADKKTDGLAAQALCPPIQLPARFAPPAPPRVERRRAVPQVARHFERASGYQYAAADALDMDRYSHHWAVAPQGYVPPVAYAPPDQGADYGPQAYNAPAIQVDQDGWVGGVGYTREGGGGGGGGGGGVLTLAQPDSLNGPNYNNFGTSYGGDYQSANQVATWRTQAFTPPANSGSSSGSATK